MGYRSEVKCIIYGEHDKLNAYIITHRLILNSDVFTHFKENLTKYEIDLGDKKLLALDLYGSSWKWYNGYKDIDVWMKFMRESVESGLSFQFLRIGEGDGDSIEIERENGGEEQSYCFLYPSRPNIEEDINRGENLPL